MKKITALLLAVLMFALPVLGFAESPAEMVENAVAAGQPLHTAISFGYGEIPGLEPEVGAIIDELLGALSITVDQQQGDAPQTDIAVQLLKNGEQNDVLTLSVAEKGENNYLASNLLGKGVVAFNAEEGKVILERLIDMGVQAEMFTESDAAEIKQMLDSSLSQTAQFDAEAFAAEMEEVDFTALMDVATKLMEKAKVEEVTAQPKNCDAAAQMITVSFTGEDIAQIYDVIFDVLKNNKAFMQGFASTFATSAEINGEPMTAEQFMEQAPQVMREALAMIQGDVPVVIYLDEAGEPVSMTMAMTMKAETEDGKTETMTMDMTYARLTVSEGVTHNVNVIAKEENNTGVAMSFSLLDNPEKTTANFAADSLEGDVAKPVMNVTVTLKKEYGDVESKEDMDIVITLIDSDTEDVVTVRIEMESEAEKVIEGVVQYESEMEFYVMDFEEEIFSINVNQVTGAATESIAVDDVVRPGAMTDEEFGAYAEGVGSEAMNALIGLLMNLPDSILALLLQ